MKICLKNIVLTQHMNSNPYLGFMAAVNFKSTFFQLYIDYNELKGKNINKYDFYENLASCQGNVFKLLLSETT